MFIVHCSQCCCIRLTARKRAFGATCGCRRGARRRQSSRPGVGSAEAAAHSGGAEKATETDAESGRTRRPRRPLDARRARVRRAGMRAPRCRRGGAARARAAARPLTRCRRTPSGPAAATTSGSACHPMARHIAGLIRASCTSIVSAESHSRTNSAGELAMNRRFQNSYDLYSLM